jgi:large subunit ribosomal protein L9
MKIILLQNVPNLGVAGDVVEVKPGYGRNYLIPRKMGDTLSKKALAEVEEVKRVAVQRSQRDLAKAQELAKTIENHTVKLTGKVGTRGSKLYGSVTTQQIATAVSSFLGMEVDKRKISLEEPIRTLGLHNYTIKLHPDVEVKSRVEVVKPVGPE